ncbi:MAG: YkgJ family cysteine cluster protein, partial [Planctomycetota bacterium]
MVPLADERDRIAARAHALGVRFPFDGAALRLVMGRCVFYDRGCRLHAAFGPSAKPAVCRQFPWVRRGEAVGVDPACGHADGVWTAPEGPLLGVDGPSRAELPAGDLAELAQDVELT